MRSVKQGKGGAKERKKMGLGRGLASLIPDIDSIDNTPSEFFHCDIDEISPNPFQPRRIFAEEELEELSRSIRENGIIQPLLVRRKDTGYELIAGERRLRAAAAAELKTVPVVLKEISDRELLELSIIENIQRENLNPMEESMAYKRLMDEFGFTQDKVAKQVGKSRSAVANFLRLGGLPREIQDALMKNNLSMGHARALLGAANPDQQTQAFIAVIEKELSVRETENLVKKLKAGEAPPAKPPKPPENPRFKTLAKGLTSHFNTKVDIRKKGKKGKVEITFSSEEELERLVNMLGLPE